MTSDTIFREYRISDAERRLYNVLFASDLAGKRPTMKSPVQNKPNFPPVSLRISRSRVSELEHLRRPRNASSHDPGSGWCLAEGKEPCP
jgi:hypothetical protein